MTTHSQKTDTPATCWRTAALLVATGLVSAALAAPASAQYRRDNDGRALDSNPRSGSYGSNDDARNNVGLGRGPMVTGNQIVTGNVTGGRQFRDVTLYRDPSAFRGPVAGGVSDRFVRDSAGVPRPGAAQMDLRQPTAFYGSERAAPPPVGYLPTAGATGGYIPSSSAFVTQRGASDTLNNLGYSSSLRSSELVLPTTDANNQRSMLSASPVYGVRVWPAGRSPNDFLTPGAAGMPGMPGVPGAAGRDGLPTGGGQFGQGGLQNPADRFRLDPNGILRMRDEVNRAAGMDGDDRGRQGQGQGEGQGQGQDGGATGLIQPIGASPGGGVGGNEGGGQGAAGERGGAGGAISAQGLSAPLSSTAIGTGSTATNQSLRYRLLVPAEQQTPLLADMRRRFERQHGGQGTADGVAANRQFNLERRMVRQAEQQRQQAAQPDQPGQPGQGGAPGVRPGVGGFARPGIGGGSRVLTPGGAAPAPATGDAPATQDASPAVPPPGETVAPTPPARPDGAQPDAAQPEAAAPAPQQPVRINSVAAGVQAKGLRDVLASAEQSMREQKYSAALEKYQTAHEVAPNNPLILMGRANALLAASYYRRAETDLRDALAQAPHLVQAQFDLKSLVGPERLQTVVKDLKEMADADPQQARPLLLLAYVAYNTGNEEQAATYLASAEKRAQGNDPLLKAWRQHWTLPKSPPPDANK